MLTTACCPICRQNTWQCLADRSYRRSDYDLTSDEYLIKRLRVLFQVWFPDQEAVQLICHLCKTCGFVTNFPRVEEADIDAKYQFLESAGQDYGSFESEEIEKLRSFRLWKRVARFMKPASRILDFGGGDGRLMHEFAARGHACFLIDYNRSPRPYVEKLGDKADELDEESTFDLIVCNHVIEHVADPVGTLTRLAKHLTERGVLFVEVPMEIWRKAPLTNDPVTHVNFFCDMTLRRTFQEAGMQVVEADTTGYLHPSGRLNAAVFCIGKRSTSAVGSAKFDSGTAQVRRFLNPSLLDRIWRKWKVR